MGRVVYIIRHGTSEGNRHNQASFGPEGGALNEIGIQEAKILRQKLQNFGIDVQTEPVASSLSKRTYETAFYAGFKQINKYHALNEIDGNLLCDELDALLERKEAPPSAILAAQNLLTNPPQEKVWVTHGQLIAGIAYVLKIPKSILFIPKMGTITTLEFVPEIQLQ